MGEMVHFNSLSDIVHGVTQKTSHEGVYGGFNLADHVGDDAESVQTNRLRLAQMIGIEKSQLIFAHQTHSTNVAIIHEVKESVIEETDALITNLRGVCLNVLTADCVPIMLYDAVNQAVGVVHAGWKGTAGKIVEKTVLAMQKEYNTSPSDLLVGIGPCISKEVYEVGEEVASQFPSDCWSVKQNGKFNLDLVQANTCQLIASGVQRSCIETSGICTFQSNNFYSARREGIASGRFSSFVMLKRL